MSKAIGWEMDSGVLALSFISLSPGFTGNNSFTQTDEPKRAITETLILGLLGVFVSRSYWPIVIPVAYLSYDWIMVNHNVMTMEMSD